MNNKQTYLVVTPFFPSEDSFVGSYVFDQINEIRNQSVFTIEVVKVTSLFSKEKDYIYKGFRVSVFKTIDIPFFIFPGIFNWLNKIRFKTLLNRRKIENVVFSHSHVSYPAAYLIEDLVCKKIVQHHGLDVLQLLNGRSDFLKKVQRKYLIKNTIRHLNKVDLNIGVSQLVLNKLREHPSYSPKDELVLYNGVDTSKFYPIEVEKNKIFTIGCVANFWEIKDQITLIKAIEIIFLTGEKILLRLIGSGPKLDECCNYVKEHNLDAIISFESEQYHIALNIFYNEIDLFVLPSYYEALGCVYLESWATNTPFIGIENQGINEILPDKKKMLAKVKDVHDLADKIKFFMNSDFKLDTFSIFDINQTISDFLKLNIFKNND